MAERFHEVAAEGTVLTLDLAVGHIRSWEIARAGRRLRPLHTVPWVDDPQIANDPEIPPNLKYLSGDFFCAPFGANDVDIGAPPHGWPANSPWRFVGEKRRAGAVTARFVLEKRVFGATLTKEITLCDEHPFAYQRHVFEGGEGEITAASHPITHFNGAGRLSFSRKAFAELPPVPQETDPRRGRSLFARSARVGDLARLPLADGTTVDATRYPVASGHEDFVMLVEAAGVTFGWAAAAREAEREVLLSLKNPAEFPTTCVWYSNGGRYYPPWNRRCFGVVGIEEARALASEGHAAALAPNALSKEGIPTTLKLDPEGSVSVRHVIGGLELPEGWSVIEAVAPGDGVLRVRGDGGDMTVPFDDRFLA